MLLQLYLSRVILTNIADSSEFILSLIVLKGEFSRAVSNEGQNGMEFERILQEVAVLTQDLGGYEMIKSQNPLINDWIESDYLHHKALPLDGKIGNMVHQIQSTEISETEK